MSSNPQTMNDIDPFEKYDEYTDMFDPILTDRQARRKRKPKAKHTPKVSYEEMMANMVGEESGIEGQVRQRALRRVSDPVRLRGRLRPRCRPALSRARLDPRVRTHGVRTRSVASSA